MSSDRGCRWQELTLGRSVRALRMENELLAVTILPDKGADIYELIYKPQQMDVLWKAPWGMKEPGLGVPTATNSLTAWMDYYAGGWQEIFPSGGGPCHYKGVELNFHGEASTVAWQHAVTVDGGDAVELEFTTRLFRSPFRLRRSMRIEAGQPLLRLRERITNEGGEPMDYMWGHHPAYGAPFLSGACRIDIGARAFQADDGLVGTANPLTVGQRYRWPHTPQGIDMSQVPDAATPRDTLAYFQEFAAGWYAITNTELGFGVGLVWPREIFPYAWFWQEMHGSGGYPWYKGVYVMAIEPFSTIPGQGLTTAMEKTATHRTLAAGESVEAELAALFYTSTHGVEEIRSDGTVVVKER